MTLQPYIDMLYRLDRQDIEVTDWEAGFLADNLQRSLFTDYRLSDKQKAVIRRMAERYIGPEAAAELAGQQRML